MHTLSGRRFEIGTKYAPTVKDIAIGLSRIPRWAGATVRPWSVLQHSLAAGVLVENENDPILHLAALAHDMEEMATGDIPKPFKTTTQSELGKRIRAWMYLEVFTQPSPDERTEEKVKAIDKQLRLAELLCLCHPRAWQDPYFTGEVARFFLQLADEGSDAGAGQNELLATSPDVMPACDAVWDLIDMPEREAIFLFTEQVTTLLRTKRLMSMERRA